MKDQKKIPVIIDCDPGIDDMMALIVAFASGKLDIRAITTVAGNVSVENTTQNARTILGTMQVQNQIFRGSDGPLLGDVIEASDVHGGNGLGGFTTEDEKLHPLGDLSAVQAIRQILMESNEPMTIIAVGPLTNIAILLKTYPELKSRIEQFSIMGGGLSTGNHTAAAEFNILADPEAADIVFRSGIPIIMAGLDVTEQAFLTKDDHEKIRAMGNPVSNMAAKALDFSFHKQSEQFCCMHDVLSVLVLLYPEIFEGEDLHVVVETGGRYSRGYTLADRRMRNRETRTNCHVLMGIDRNAFLKYVFDAVGFYQ